MSVTSAGGGGSGDGSSYHDGSRNDHLESTFIATISARSVDTVRIVKPSNRLVVGGSSYNPTTTTTTATTTTNAPSNEEKKATATATAVMSDEDMDDDDDDDEDMLVYDHGYDDGDYDGYGEEY